MRMKRGFRVLNVCKIGGLWFRVYQVGCVIGKWVFGINVLNM